MLLLMLFLITIAARGSDKSMSVVPAGEILAKIENGTPVNYDHVIIRGGLDLNNQYPKTQSRMTSVNSSMTITNSVIEGDVSLKGLTFLDRVYFWNTTFNGTADLSYSRFYGDAAFIGSEFDGLAIFKNTMCTKSADFTKNNFTKGADFRNSTLKDCQFSNSMFNHYASFPLSNSAPLKSIL